jgi:hypothetical protein
MDLGNKTLAQLAAEHNEVKYVTLEVASKLSGYTQEYLTRLCRLGKIDYRLWNSVQIVPELESLLRETHTILVSYEGINFINKEETTSDSSQTPNAQSVSMQTGMASEKAQFTDQERKELFMYVGRPVISDEENMSKTKKIAPSLEHERVSENPVQTVVPTKKEPFVVQVETDIAPTVQSTVEPVEKGGVVSEPSAHADPQSIDHNNLHQDWDTLLLGGDTGMHSQVFEQPKAIPTEGEDDRKQKQTESDTGEDEKNIHIRPDTQQTSFLIQEEHHLMNIDTSPLTNSTPFQVAVVAVLLGLSGLMGWMNMSDKPDNEVMASVGMSQDEMTNVKSLFSDQVIVTKDEREGIVTVRPVFQSGEGEPQEFELIPVGK